MGIVILLGKLGIILLLEIKFYFFEKKNLNFK